MGNNRRWVTLAGGIALTLAFAKPAAGLLVDMAGHWSSPVVAALASRRIVSGDEQGRFSPEAPLTRAQLAKLLVASLGYQEDADILGKYRSRYVDIPDWHWAKGYVESLAELAVVEGYPDGTFGPEDTVTRAQLAVILVRATGMADQARASRFEKPGFADDAEIPEWALGYVHVARATGLMAGFEDGRFRPLRPVTRAEGSVALFRLMDTRGRMFHLTGTLVRFDPVSRQGTVRDELGHERSFTMSGEAQYYRGGAPSASSQIKVLDQVWVVLGADGTGTFLDARFKDILGSNLRTSGTTATVTLPDGSRSYPVSPGVLTFLNGRPSTLENANGAQAAYLMLDTVTGQVRVLDTVRASTQGRLIGVDVRQLTIHVQVEQHVRVLRTDSSAVFVVNGEKAALADLLVGDRLLVAANEADLAIYVLAER